MSNNRLNLDILARNRNALLLAETAAWLHDMGKCADAFLKSGGMGFKAPSGRHVNPHKAIFECKDLKKLSYWNKLRVKGRNDRLEEAKHSTALWNTLHKLSLSVSLEDIIIQGLGQTSFKEIILWGRPLVAQHHQQFQNVLGADLTYFSAVLGQAHKSAHMEKEDEADGGTACYITTPFGFVVTKISDLNEKLSMIFSALEQETQSLRREVRKHFAMAPGDTRRPINEVTLWDWSSIVAALYKAELARCMLTNERRDPAQIGWRLLSVRTDGLAYLFSVSSIPDLLARKKLLDEALDRVKALLEDTYPLGLEVYRDENGVIFVVPDLDVLELNHDEKNKSLKDLILEQFNAEGQNEQSDLCGEVVPSLKVDRHSWKGQPPSTELPPLSDHFYKPRIKSDIQSVSDAWSRVADTCIVCGLRPQGPGKKAAARNVCNTCEERRADRSKEWATTKLHTTIWTNEVADTNGRLALVVGRFNLTHWLSGNLVRTLAVREPNDRNGHDADKIAKNPSFARLRRIWETTRRFWQEVCPAGGDDADANLARSLMGEKTGQKGPRLAVEGAFRPRNEGENNSTLFPAHAYALVLPNGVRLSVVWDAKNNRFIVADNLEYLSGKTQLGEDIRAVLKKGRTFTVEEPAGYGEKNKVLGKISLSEDTETVGSEYTPVIPLLAEPQTFMALIPAEKALAAVAAVKEKYEREAGKVRNRLPLHLGVVFAHRRTPVRAVLDAGRQMLRQSGEAKGWRVICSARKLACRGDQPPERFAGDKQFNECFEVTLEKDDRRVTWYVPAVMGDGNTEDKWYPYVFLETGTEPTDRARRYKTCNPWTGNDGWLVHVCELKVDDKVFFTPSTIDYEFLDVTSRRFEIHYDEAGRRSTRRTRPYYLDDLNRLDMVWAHMKKLERAQRYKVISAIEATREAWFGEDRDDRSIEDKVFRRFAHDTLAGAAWPKTHKWAGIDEKERKALIEAGVRGELADLAELHMEICKEKG